MSCAGRAQALMIPFLSRAAAASCGCDLPQCVFSHDFTFSERDENPSSAVTHKDWDNWLLFRQAQGQCLSWNYPPGPCWDAICCMTPGSVWIMMGCREVLASLNVPKSFIPGQSFHQSLMKCSGKQTGFPDKFIDERENSPAELKIVRLEAEAFPWWRRQGKYSNTVCVKKL